MKETAFVQCVRLHYRISGRHTLPWRTTSDPYRIVISEVMLQQTQVDRVVPKYAQFLKRFPTVRALAKAPLSDVLEVWNGLGYNRRAKFLHEMARTVVTLHKGKFPQTFEELKVLPGIGPYTAGAIAAFAYNHAVPMIETNIRTVYLHHFFKNKSGISDAQLRTIIAKTLDTKNPREWYWALMDYGSYLKKQGNSIHRKSSHYTKQSAFVGSRRQIRGAIIRELLKKTLTFGALATATKKEKEIILSVLQDLQKEGLIAKNGQRYSITAS